MQTDKLNVNETLKVKRLLTEMRAELSELETVRAAYNHFLASYQSQLYCDAALQVRENFETVKASIAALKIEMQDAEQTILVVVHKPRKEFDYQYSDLEAHAIRCFNTDRKFLITE